MQRRSTNVNANSRTQSNANDRTFNPDVNRPDPLPDIPQVLDGSGSNHCWYGGQEPTKEPANNHCCQGVARADKSAKCRVSDTGSDVRRSSSEALGVGREDQSA
jgi:hypothetical protein